MDKTKSHLPRGQQQPYWCQSWVRGFLAAHESYLLPPNSAISPTMRRAGYRDPTTIAIRNKGFAVTRPAGGQIRPSAPRPTGNNC